MQYSIPQIGEYVDGVSPYISKKALDERKKGLKFLDRNFGGFTLDNIAKLNVVAVRNHYRTLHTRQTLVRYFNDVSLFMEWCKNSGLIESHNWGREMYQGMGDDSPFRYQLKERKEPMATVQSDQQGIAQSTNTAQCDARPVPVVRSGISQPACTSQQGVARETVLRVLPDETMKEAIAGVGKECPPFLDGYRKKFPDGSTFKKFTSLAQLVSCVREDVRNIDVSFLRARLIRGRLHDRTCVDPEAFAKSTQNWLGVKSIIECFAIPPSYFSDYDLDGKYRPEGKFDVYESYKERAKALFALKKEENQDVMTLIANEMGMDISHVTQMFDTGCCYHGYIALAGYIDMPALWTDDIMLDTNFEYLVCIQRLINEATARYKAQTGKKRLPFDTDFRTCGFSRFTTRKKTYLARIKSIKNHLGDELYSLLRKGISVWCSQSVIDESTVKLFKEDTMKELKSKNEQSATVQNAPSQTKKVKKAAPKEEQEETVQSVPCQPEEISTLPLDEAIARSSWTTQTLVELKSASGTIESLINEDLKSYLREGMKAYIKTLIFPAMRVDEDDVDDKF